MASIRVSKGRWRTWRGRRGAVGTVVRGEEAEKELQAGAGERVDTEEPAFCKATKKTEKFSGAG